MSNSALFPVISDNDLVMQAHYPNDPPLFVKFDSKPASVSVKPY